MRDELDRAERARVRHIREWVSSLPPSDFVKMYCAVSGPMLYYRAPYECLRDSGAAVGRDPWRLNIRTTYRCAQPAPRTTHSARRHRLRRRKLISAAAKSEQEAYNCRRRPLAAEEMAGPVFVQTILVSP